MTRPPQLWCCVVCGRIGRYSTCTDEGRHAEAPCEPLIFEDYPNGTRPPRAPRTAGHGHEPPGIREEHSHE